MATEPTEHLSVGELRLNDESTIVFETYSLGNRRLGSARIFRESARYTGPTRAGMDMELQQLEQLLPILRDISTGLENGEIVPQVEAGRIPAGRSSNWVVRLLEPDVRRDSVALDIRKYVSTDRFTGWTRRGMRVPADVIDEMIPWLERMCEQLIAWREGRSGLLALADEEAQADDAPEEPALPSVPPEYRELF